MPGRKPASSAWSRKASASPQGAVTGEKFERFEVAFVGAGRDREFARRRGALVVPFGQQKVGQRLVTADQHLGLRQHEFAEGVEVALQLVFLDPRQVGHVGDQRHVGVVRQDLGDRADALGGTEEADLPGRDRHVLQDAAGLFGDHVGVDGVVVEDLVGVAHHDAGDDRQAVRTHRGDRRDVAGHAAGAARVAGIEAHHAGRRRLFLRDVGVGLGGGGFSGHRKGPRALVKRSSEPFERPWPNL